MSGSRVSYPRTKTMPSNVAGSAIAQGHNVGRIDWWPQWKPTSIETKWLLLSGASNPPSGIVISDRRTRDTPGAKGGTFLSGVAHDLANMEAAVGINLFNTVKDLYLTKSAASDHIRSLLDTCRRNQVKPILYYTGHGEIGTGNWCFADGTISIQEIFDMRPEGAYTPMIFSDACYSGHWANFCLEKNITGFHCLAACLEYSKAFDTKGEGGDLTLFMTGKKRRPRTEPLYSGGNRRDFPITTGYDSVDSFDFIKSHVSQNILVCQSFYNGSFSGCFASSKRYSPRPVASWGILKDYDSFLKLVKESEDRVNGNSQQIYSLACDEILGFAVFRMGKYGTAQAIVTNLSDIQKKWEDGFEITSCAARGSTFYIVMTKGTEEYRDKQQMWFTCNTWNETRDEINEQIKVGYTVTGICYCTGLRQYFVVTTEIPEVKSSHHFDDTTAALNWMDEQHLVGYHPTVIFTDSTLNKTLVVMTTDEDRSSYQYTFGYKFKLPS